MKGDHCLMSLPISSSQHTPQSSSKFIKFYNRDERYYEFTNFYRAPVLIDGKKWPTTEHYFQAQKFIGTPYVEAIRRLPTAREAFQLSRDPKVSRWRRSDWDTVKDDIMHKALICKFTQHPDLRKMLWKTGDSKLIEHTTNDSYWGDGGGLGLGKNKLGELLMKVRDEIVSVQGQYKPRKKSATSDSRSKIRRWSSLSNLSSSDVEGSVLRIQHQSSDDLTPWRSVPKSTSGGSGRTTNPHTDSVLASQLNISHRDKPQYSSGYTAPVRAGVPKHSHSSHRSHSQSLPRCRYSLQTLPSKLPESTKDSVPVLGHASTQRHRTCGDSRTSNGSHKSDLSNNMSVADSQLVMAVASPLMSRRIKNSPVIVNFNPPSTKHNTRHASYNPITHKYKKY